MKRKELERVRRARNGSYVSLVPEPADIDGDAASNATGSHASEPGEDGDATERAPDADATDESPGVLTAATAEPSRNKQRVSEQQPGDATERAD